MKKTILILTLILLIIIPFSYSIFVPSEFGNFNTIGYDSANRGMNTDEYYCFSHRFYKTGEISNISAGIYYSGGGCNCEFNIINSLQTGNILYNENFTDTDFRNPIKLSENVTVFKDETKYLCFRELSGSCRIYLNLGGTHNLLRLQSIYYPYSDNNFQNTILPDEYGVYNGSSFPITDRYIDFSTHRCGGYQYTDGDGRFFPCLHNNNIISSQNMGEIFYFPYTANITGLEMLTVRGTSQPVYMTLELKDEDSSIVLRNCNISNSTFSQNEYEKYGCAINPIEIDQGMYSIYWKCYKDSARTTKCDGINEYAYLLTHEGHFNGIYDDYFLYNGGNFDIDRSFSISGLTIYEDTYFKLFMDSIASINFTNYCPVDNCIWYDNFNQYDNYEDISNGGWSGFTSQAIVLDNIVYLNSTFAEQKLGNIEYDLPDHDYKDVGGVIQFQINNSPQPESFNTDTINFLINTICEETQQNVFSYLIRFWNNEEISLSENRTIANIYHVTKGKQEQLGSIIVDNGNYISIQHKIINDVAYLDIFTKNIIESGYIPENTFSFTLNTPCLEIGKVDILRQDVDHPDLDFFIGIDQIYFYGIQDIEDTDLSFEFTNKTTQNESIVKTDVGEELNNMAYTLGFKSKASKLFFWFLCTFFFLAVLYGSKIDMNTKLISGVGVFVLMTVIGFYFKFVDIVTFTFIIFIFAVIGALAYSRLFKQSV